MARTMFCTRCLTEGVPKNVTKGSFAVEVALWFLFCLPGIVYSLWRLTSKHPACPSCGAIELVPPNSPAAKRLRG